MFLKFFNFRYFFISFAIGVFYIYLTNEHKKVIVIYPNPTNLEKYTYVDKSNNCFQYNLEETTCPSDSSKYKDIKVEY
jgi:hypothetical protein